MTTVCSTTVVTVFGPLAAAVVADVLVRNGRMERAAVVLEEVGTESGGLAVTKTVFRVVTGGSVTVTVTVSTSGLTVAVAIVLLDTAWMPTVLFGEARNCWVSWTSMAASLRSWPLI